MREWGDHGFAARFGKQAIGPATLRSADVRVRGKSVEDLLAFADALAPELHLEKRCQVSEVIGNVLTPGTGVTAFRCTLDGPARQALLKAILNAEMSVCYCSVYEECWTVSNHHGTESIPACPSFDASFVQVDYADPRSDGLFVAKDGETGDGG